MSGIVDHHCLNFLVINYSIRKKFNNKPWENFQQKTIHKPVSKNGEVVIGLLMLMISLQHWLTRLTNQLSSPFKIMVESNNHNPLLVIKCLFEKDKLVVDLLFPKGFSNLTMSKILVYVPEMGHIHQIDLTFTFVSWIYQCNKPNISNLVYT